MLAQCLWVEMLNPATLVATEEQPVGGGEKTGAGPPGTWPKAAPQGPSAAGLGPPPAMSFDAHRELASRSGAWVESTPRATRSPEPALQMPASAWSCSHGFQHRRHPGWRQEGQRRTQPGLPPSFMVLLTHSSPRLSFVLSHQIQLRIPNQKDHPNQ